MTGIENRQTERQSVWDELAQALSPIEYRPQLLPGVEASPQKTRHGVPYVVIRSPIANSYLKLDPRESELLDLMDGHRTIKALVVAYYQRHGVLALPRISALVRLLRTRHFLTDPPLDVYTALESHLRRPDAGSLLLRLIKGFRQSEFCLPAANRVLDAWYQGWARFFFTIPATLLGLVLTICGPVFFLLELGRGRYDLFRAGGSYLTTVLLMAVLEIFSLLIHELGHGLAMKHAKRQVRSAGLMIYYGMLAGFVDTTDIWMAPRRFRLLASLAGPWTGLVLGGILAVLAYFLPRGPAGAFVFAWGSIFLGNNLMNFNPLLEFDGYYLLVDLIEKPMLRSRAFSFLRRELVPKLWQRERLSREEHFFALFGLASVAWSLLAIFMALQFWEARAASLIGEAWNGNDLTARLLVVLLGVLVLTPLVLALWNGAKKLVQRMTSHLFWLHGKMVARRRREAMTALRAVPLWAPLPEARLLEIARVMQAEDFSAGRHVVCQGDHGDRFYIIARGELEVSIDEEPAAILGPGDYFGERALLNDAPRSATVTTLTSALLFSLDRASFATTLAHDVATRSQLDAALNYRSELAAMPLFQDLTPSELDLLLTKLQPISTMRGEVIVRQGEPGDRFYLIRSGQLEVLRDGKRIGTLTPGEAFGEIALLLDVPRTATVRTMEPAELLALSADDFRDMLGRYCGRAEDLEHLAHRRLESHERHHELGSTDDLLHPEHGFGAN